MPVGARLARAKPPTTPTFPGFPLGVTAGTYARTFNLLDPASYNPDFITSAFNPSRTVAGANAALVSGIAAGETYFTVEEFKSGRQPQLDDLHNGREPEIVELNLRPLPFACQVNSGGAKAFPKAVRNLEME